MLLPLLYARSPYAVDNVPAFPTLTCAPSLATHSSVHKPWPQTPVIECRRCRTRGMKRGMEARRDGMSGDCRELLEMFGGNAACLCSHHFTDIEKTWLHRDAMQRGKQTISMTTTTTSIFHAIEISQAVSHQSQSHSQSSTSVSACPFQHSLADSRVSQAQNPTSHRELLTKIEANISHH